MENGMNIGDEVRRHRLLIWLGFSTMAFCAAKLLRTLSLAQGAAAGGASPARLLWAYIAWLAALVAVFSAVALRRLPRAMADVVDRARMVRAAPFPLLAVCTAHLLRVLAEAADHDQALVDSRAAAARLVRAYAVWLLVLVATLAPVAGLPPRAVSAVRLSAVVACFIDY
ncbi:uncharacterized protein LOC121982482 [Zingiber officinale]|uniref:uncharacterized protein LOC121982482 n=1 Tax=Zingiber officinale TaxID=94328 RepID=UPI001C4DD6FC|nr:uncharacterized protein LOC121982482 [Zingiber officinale]